MNSQYIGPKIVETKLTDPPSTVGLTCCPFTLNPVVVDESMTATGYDTETGEVITKLTAQAFGPILFDEHEIVEVHRSMTQKGKVVRKEVHFIGVIDETIQCRLREVKPSTLDVLVEDTIENMVSVFPLDLAPDHSGNRTVKYIQGDYVATETFHDAVVGLFNVEIDEEMEQCVCLETRRENTEGRVVKSYISCETGRVILVRFENAAGDDSFQLVEWTSLQKDASPE